MTDFLYFLFSEFFFYLDSNNFRSKQICRILKFAVQGQDRPRIIKRGACSQLKYNVNVIEELKKALHEQYALGVYWLGDSNYRLPLETFDLTKKQIRNKKLEVTNKQEVINTLAEIGNPRAANHKLAVTKLRENDVNSLKESFLWKIGATVNQPYPIFPPSYPFCKMQPHELKLRLSNKGNEGEEETKEETKEEHQYIEGEDEENILARDLVNNWMVGKPAPDEGAIHQKYKKLQISKIQVLTTTTERVGTPDAEYTGHKEFGTKDDETIDDDAISEQEHVALLTIVSKDLYREEKRKFNLIRQRKRLEAKVPRIARVFGGDDEDDEDDESISQQELKRSIEAVFTLTEKEVMKVKGEGTATALNIGYLDRLFIIAPPETVVSRDLEVQAVLYGGDHLPQLFHITATQNDVAGRGETKEEEVADSEHVITAESGTQSHSLAPSLRANSVASDVARGEGKRDLTNDIETLDRYDLKENFGEDASRFF